MKMVYVNKCKENRGNLYLTVDKVYDVVGTNNLSYSERVIILTNDNNQRLQLPLSWFISVEEYRDKKLNKILR